ncbi:MAG: reverse transcriptase family protein, partial [Kangiellaceae bacterium]|nr:reverse transcriptase family protein [Kangiellaceae bacterium]
MDRRPHLNLTFSGLFGNCLIDTGASKSIISSDFYFKFASGMDIAPTPLRLQTITGEKLTSLGQVNLPIDKIGAHSFIIIPSLLYKDVILGQDFCAKFSLNIRFDCQVVEIKERSYPFSYPSRENGDEIPLPLDIIKIEEVIRAPSWLKDIPSHNVFREEIGHCTSCEPISIKTVGEPFKMKAYRQALTKRKIVESEIEKMLGAGVIRPSQSPWASPITLVPKKTGEVRFCVDYRRINSMTIRDSYPLPNIQDIFDTLGGSKYFTTLDLRSGYWQIDLDKESIPKTAFVCHT